MHTINHFKHLRDTDPAEAESVRQQTEDHLAIIDQRIQQSIEMLNRVPNFAKKIKVQIGRLPENSVCEYKVDHSLVVKVLPQAVKIRIMIPLK